MQLAYINVFFGGASALGPLVGAGRLHRLAGRRLRHGARRQLKLDASDLDYEVVATSLYHLPFATQQIDPNAVARHDVQRRATDLSAGKPAVIVTFLATEASGTETCQCSVV